MNSHKHRKDTEGNPTSMHVSSASLEGGHDFEAHSIPPPLPWFSTPLREHVLERHRGEGPSPPVELLCR